MLRAIKNGVVYMTSIQQFGANRRNALLSTGAKTQEGKAIVAKNKVDIKLAYYTI